MGLTCFDHPVTRAAVLTKFKIIDRENLLANAAAIRPHLQQSAKALLTLNNVSDLHGMGLMLGTDLVADRSFISPLLGASEAIFKGCVNRSAIVRLLGRRVILWPPLVIDKTECDTIIAATQDFMTGSHHA